MAHPLSSYGELFQIDSPTSSNLDFFFISYNPAVCRSTFCIFLFCYEIVVDVEQLFKKAGAEN